MIHVYQKNSTVEWLERGLLRLAIIRDVFDSHKSMSADQDIYVQASVQVRVHVYVHVNVCASICTSTCTCTVYPYGTRGQLCTLVCCIYSELLITNYQHYMQLSK